jgi:hypothetical protein
VLPTVPSKRTEPVCGCSNPSSSASSITRISVILVRGRTAKSYSILHRSTWIQELLISDESYESTSHFPNISTPNASLKELIRIKGVLPE